MEQLEEVLNDLRRNKGKEQNCLTLNQVNALHYIGASENEENQDGVGFQINKTILSNVKLSNCTIQVQIKPFR